MNLLNRYILFVQYIVIRFVPQAISVKTYEVRRINESAYLVTSFPEYDYGTSRGIDLNSDAKVVSMDDQKKVLKSGHNIGDNSNGMSMDENPHKHKQKISPFAIKDARKSYFKNFYATMRKVPITTLASSASPTYSGLLDSDLKDYKGAIVPVDSNLITARKLASILVYELQYSDQEYLKNMERIKRRRNRK